MKKMYFLDNKNSDQSNEEKNVNIYNKIRCTALSDSKIAFTQKKHCQKAPSMIENAKEKKILQEKISEMDRFMFSAKQQFSYSTETDRLCTNMDLLDEEDEDGEESEEVDKLDTENSEELQNLISSLSGIPELKCEEERKGLHFVMKKKLKKCFSVKMNVNSDVLILGLKIIISEIDRVKSLIISDNQVSLDSICGLSQVKETLLNIFIYPAIFPHFFPVKIRWCQILLYGPPGTGKTMLAKAIATEINATLHRISSADLLSHWQGETEKQIRILFEEIRTNPEPAILFFDEIDGLCRRRTNVENDNIRRIKTELLTQFDDFVRESASQSYIIGATNCPWEIDCGFMRRFNKKIFVPLPDKEARLSILRKSFENIETDLTDSEWNEIGRSTEGYTGSDLVNIVMMSCCERFMQTKKCKYWEAKGDLWIPATSNSLFLTRMSFEDIPQYKLGCRNIILADLQAAIKNTPKTVTPEEMLKYLEYSAKIK